jgi:hypothetical protein
MSILKWIGPSNDSLVKLHSQNAYFLVPDVVEEHQKYFNFSVKEFSICTFASRLVCHRLHTRSLKQMEEISTVEGQNKKLKKTALLATQVVPQRLSSAEHGLRSISSPSPCLI